MFFADALVLDAPRRTRDGYLAVRAKAARVGVYDYAGSEVDPDNAHGLRDQSIVKVLRDEATVFDAAAVRTFIGKPVTDDHPKEAVTRDNWRDHGRGVIMGALRDGDHLAFDLLLMDGPTIDKVTAGKRELSNGYAAELEFGDFEAPDGTKCHARQSRISDGNHVAIVDRARGGESCRIADAKPCAAQPQSFLDSLTIQEKPVKKILLDGLTVDLADVDTAEATVRKLETERNEARDAKAKADRDLAAKDTEITDLKAKVSDQATIDALADAKADVVTRGKALLGDAMPDTKGRTAAELRRAIVLAATKDAALADRSDDYIEARFDGLKVADGKPNPAPLGMPMTFSDAGDIRDAARAASLLN